MPTVRKSILFYSLFFLFSMLGATAYSQETLTIATYYPTPVGSFDTVVSDKLGVGDTNGDGFVTTADVPAASGDIALAGALISTRLDSGWIQRFGSTPNTGLKWNNLWNDLEWYYNDVKGGFFDYQVQGPFAPYGSTFVVEGGLFTKRTDSFIDVTNPANVNPAYREAELAVVLPGSTVVGSGAAGWIKQASFKPWTYDYAGNIYVTNNAWRVGIGTNTPAAKLDIVTGVEPIAQMGDLAAATGGYSIAIGRRATASGGASVVAGGELNTASALYSTVCGGMQNTAGASYSVAAGGTRNSAGGWFSAVSGGDTNIIGAGSDFSVISGGGHNGCSVNDYATVGGGLQNLASGLQSVVGGGSGNTASGFSSVVAGGGDFATATGNSAQANFSTVSGGASNVASAVYSTIAGGAGNVASGDYSMITGGTLNSVVGDRSVISGGWSNSITGASSTIGGGFMNAVDGFNGIISGGSSNTINIASNYAVINGGSRNTCGADYATVSGGFWNTASGLCSWAGGRQAQALSRSSYVWGGDFGGVDLGVDTYNIYAAGGAFLNGVAIATVSDQRLKKDIADLGSVLDRVCTLRGVTFYWKDPAAQGNQTGRQLGVIAQEVEKVFPEAVTENSVGYKVVNYYSLVPVLLEAVKELKAENQALRERIGVLEDKVK